MTFRQYAIIMSLASLLCWVAWGFVLTTVDPDYATASSLAFFYITLFASLFGTLSLASCTLLYFFSASSLPMYRYVQQSFHVSAAASLFIVVMLFLKAANLLSMITVSFLAIGLCGSLLLVSRKKNHSPSFFSDIS